MQKETCDVAVIGGGIIGASIAWRLAQAGRAVTILEAGKLGGEASWAGAGMLAPGGEIVEKTPWTDFTLASLSLYPAFLAELQAESDFTIDYQQLGAVELAWTPREWQALEARAAAQRPLGIDTEVLDARGLSRRLPLLAGTEPAGAMYYPADALVDPRHVMQALRIACTRRGVTICEHRAVHSLRLAERSLEAVTDTGPLTAQYGVLAAGAWSSRIPAERGGEQISLPASFPVKGHLLGYAMEPGSLGPILRHGHTYIAQRSTGFTIAGTSMEEAGFDRTVDARVVQDIETRAASLLPALRQAAHKQEWIGFRPATAGLEPELRRLEGTALWLSYGHFRNGILLAPATAQRISEQILQAR